MDYSITAKKLIKELGGEKNITSLSHCMTRLRFVLVDESVVDDKAVDAIEGVMGIMKKGGQYQVIIGNNVAKCYSELTKIASFGDGAAGKSKVKRNPIAVALDFISGCMSALIPAIIAGGLIKVLLVVLGPTLTNVLAATDQTYIILSAIGDVPFYFLPIIIAFTASKKLNCNPYLSVAVAGLLIHPDLINLLGGEGPVNFLGFIPVMQGSYASSVIPAMLSTILVKYVEILVDKITPEWSKNFLKPLLIVIIAAPITLMLLAPIGLVVGNALNFAITWIYNLSPFIALGLFAALMPLIVMTGMHWAFVPAALLALSNPGFELMLTPAMLCSNLAQASACLAVAVKTKDSKMRQTAIPSSISAFLAGVTEPALYGVTLKLKTPLIAACIGGGIAGIFAGFVNLKNFSFATPCLTAIVQFIPTNDSADMSNFAFACITAGISIVITFILTLILYKTKQPVEADGTAAKIETSTGAAISSIENVACPLNGAIVALEDVNDMTFSTGILGKGFAVVPVTGAIYAPFDGTVDTMMDTNHAVGIVSTSGINMLIHVGLETVQLEGKHFTPKVKTGDSFRKGDVLLEFDIKAIKNEGYDTVTPVVITNPDDYEITILSKETAVAGNNIMTLKKI